MSSDDRHRTGIEQLQRALGVRTAMKVLAAGAEPIEFVGAAHHEGWFDRLRGGTSNEALVAGGAVDEVSVVLAVFIAAGIVQTTDSGFRLTADFDAVIAVASAVERAVVPDADGPDV